MPRRQPNSRQADTVAGVNVPFAVRRSALLACRAGDAAGIYCNDGWKLQNFAVVCAEGGRIEGPLPAGGLLRAHTGESAVKGNTVVNEGLLVQMLPLVCPVRFRLPMLYGSSRLNTMALSMAESFVQTIVCSWV